MEKQNLRDGLVRTTNSMYTVFNNLYAILYQNAATQFSTDFMVDPNRNGTEFAKENFGGGSAANGYALVAYYDLSGALAFSTILDTPGYSLQLPPQLYKLNYGVDPYAMNVTDHNYYSFGFYMHNGRAVYFVGMPIFNDTKSPTYGFSLMAFVQTDQLTKTMVSTVSLCLSFVQIKGDYIDPHVSDYGPIVANSKITVPLTSTSQWALDPFTSVSILDPYMYPRSCSSNEVDPDATSIPRVVTTMIIQDMFGNASLMVRTDIKRSVILIGVQSICIATGILIIAIIAVSVITVLFMDFIILRRVLALTKSLRNIIERQDIDGRVHSSFMIIDDEINRLARIINSMLHSLGTASKQCEDALERSSNNEHRDRIIMDSINDFIITMTYVITFYQL
jgi:HAMP domain-containing protein